MCPNFESGIVLCPFRPKKENTGKVSESGASVIKHGLKAEKIFMQVHYLKVRMLKLVFLFLQSNITHTFSNLSYCINLSRPKWFAVIFYEVYLEL